MISIQQLSPLKNESDWDEVHCWPHTITFNLQKELEIALFSKLEHFNIMLIKIYYIDIYFLVTL